MPYFHVDITRSESTQFVVNAANKDAAQDIALAADVASKCDHKKIVKLRADHNAGVSVSETDKAAWLDTLKKAKANK